MCNLPLKNYLHIFWFDLWRILVKSAIIVTVIHGNSQLWQKFGIFDVYFSFGFGQDVFTGEFHILFQMSHMLLYVHIPTEIGTTARPTQAYWVASPAVILCSLHNPVLLVLSLPS